MHIEHIHPSQEQLQELMKLDPKVPVTMLNILRFRDKTEKGNESGMEAYARYARNVQGHLAAVGGKVIWQGTAAHVVIGSTEKPPHMILLVEYPSVQHFIKMATDPAYLEVSNDRTIALEYGGLVACHGIPLPDGR